MRQCRALRAVSRSTKVILQAQQRYLIITEWQIFSVEPRNVRHLLVHDSLHCVDYRASQFFALHGSGGCSRLSQRLLTEAIL